MRLVFCKSGDSEKNLFFKFKPTPITSITEILNAAPGCLSQWRYHQFFFASLITIT